MQANGTAEPVADVLESDADVVSDESHPDQICRNNMK